MSYNSGYNYSPYYQPTIGRDERGHSSYQNTTNGNGQYPSQVCSSSTPNNQQQSSYAPQQQQSSFAPTATSADRSSTSYARVNDVPSASQYQDSRGGYGYAPRSSVDTTALGNLAHASTLGQDSRSGTRDNSSLQQIIDYNRARNSHGYNGSIAYDTSNTGYSYSHERSDSQGTSSGDSFTRNPQTTQNQILNQYQTPQFAVSAGYSNPTPAHAATQEVSQSTSRSSYQPAREDQRQRVQQDYAQPTRPASAQSHHASTSAQNSHTSHQASQSPTVLNYRVPMASTSTSSRNVNSTHWQEHARPPSLQKPQQVQQRTSASPAPVQEKRSYYSTAANHQIHTQQQSSSSSAKSQQTSESQTTISPEEQGPRTVDPSHVFNHVEYQRRQAAAAAEAAAAKKAADAEQAKKALEADEMRKATEAATALKRVSESNQHKAQNGATLSPASSSKEEQMAAEMRLMIEKMRDFKSKDPSLFSQIWEQVKKTQPAGSVPAVPLSAKDLTGSTAAQHSQTDGTGPADAGQILSPSPTLGQSDELPDLGKFPSQRRRRGPNVNPTKKRKSAGVSEIDETAPLPNRLQSNPPANEAQQTPLDASAGRPAEENRQVVYVSGTGPRAPPQVSKNAPAPAPSSVPPAASVPAQAPQQPSSRGNTNWPEHKKWDLAVAAKNTLLRYPMNASKAQNITPEQILGLLNQNPSFEQLCRMIESKGFILERSHFARSLLDTIPDMEAGVRQRQQRNALADRQPPTPVNISQTDGAGFGILTSNPSGIRWKDDQGRQPILQPNGAPTAQMTPHNPRPLPNATPKAEEKPTVPLTKQEMARKRNIAEIVDLSQLSDDDLPPPPSKVQRIDAFVQPPPPMQQADQSYRQFQVPSHILANPFQQFGLPQFTYGPPQFHAPAQYPSIPPTAYKPGPPPPPQPPESVAPPSLSLSAQQRELINSENIVQAIDKQKDKKRKKYNPKTIVRDVLIAAGRHLTMQPLNYHLENLRKTFRHVNDLSDLSTFRWDLVDPGEPIVATPAVRAVEEIDGNDADDEEAPEPAHQNPQLTLSVDSQGSASVSMSVQTLRKNSFSALGIQY